MFSWISSGGSVLAPGRVRGGYTARVRLIVWRRDCRHQVEPE
jgi:hypothetical protein